MCIRDSLPWGDPSRWATAARERRGQPRPRERTHLRQGLPGPPHADGSSGRRPDLPNCARADCRNARAP
eukprot:12307820-Alexandrium_andersonii.AAC.1